MVKRVFNNEQVEFIKKNALSMTYREISELDMFKGITEKQLRSKGRNLGIKKIKQYDKSYFKEINTKNKAYILGFIYADGYVQTSDSGSELGIEIHENDIEILENINKEFDNIHEIRFRSRQKEYLGYHFKSHTAVLRIHSNEIVNDLISHGVVPNKTFYSDIFPEVSEEYFWEFLRGYLDGDGGFYQPKNSKSIVIHFTSSSQTFFKHLQETLLSYYGIKSGLYKENDKKFRLIVSRYSNLNFLNYLYEEIHNNQQNTQKIYLNRKYQIAKQFLGSL